MFLAILFLILAALASTLFPEWSWATVLAVSFACVAFIKARTIDYTGIDSLILGGISLILSLISWLIYFIIF